MDQSDGRKDPPDHVHMLDPPHDQEDGEHIHQVQQVQLLVLVLDEVLQVQELGEVLQVQ